jgi:hypothetical protein
MFNKLIARNVFTTMITKSQIRPRMHQLTSCILQSRLFAAEALSGNDTVYMLPFHLWLGKRVTSRNAITAVERLQKHIEVVRTVYRADGTEGVRQVLLPVSSIQSIAVETVDAAGFILEPSLSITERARSAEETIWTKVVSDAFRDAVPAILGDGDVFLQWIAFFLSPNNNSD